jgi:acyl carrier protein
MAEGGVAGADHLLAVVTGLLSRHLEPEAVGALADPDVQLATLGVTSLRLIEFIVELETEIGRELPPEALDRETFRSPRSITAAVRRLQVPRTDA